jgi:hypothetical protein
MAPGLGRQGLLPLKPVMMVAQCAQQTTERYSKVPPTGRELIANPIVSAALEKAWEASLPNDPVRRHEEGGWIYIHPPTGTILVKREWRPENFPFRNIICLRYPPIYTSFYIVADFHTHPFPGTSDPSKEYDDRYERAVGVPGLVRGWGDPKVHPGRIERRENYNGNFGYPNIPGGRW